MNPESDQQAMSDALARGEQFTRIFVGPMVEAVRGEMQAQHAEIKAALDTVKAFEGRVDKLERNQTKALIGWGVFATALSGVAVSGWAWFKGHLGIRIG